MECMNKFQHARHTAFRVFRLDSVLASMAQSAEVQCGDGPMLCSPRVSVLECDRAGCRSRVIDWTDIDSSLGKYVSPSGGATLGLHLSAQAVVVTAILLRRKLADEGHQR